MPDWLPVIWSLIRGSGRGTWSLPADARLISAHTLALCSAMHRRAGGLHTTVPGPRASQLPGRFCLSEAVSNKRLEGRRRGGHSCHFRFQAKSPAAAAAVMSALAGAAELVEVAALTEAAPLDPAVAAFTTGQQQVQPSVRSRGVAPSPCMLLPSLLLPFVLSAFVNFFDLFFVLNSLYFRFLNYQELSRLDANCYTLLVKFPTHLSLNDMPESVMSQNGDFLILLILQLSAGILLTRIMLPHPLELLVEEKTKQNATLCWRNQAYLFARLGLKSMFATLVCSIKRLFFCTIPKTLHDLITACLSSHQSFLLTPNHPCSRIYLYFQKSSMLPLGLFCLLKQFCLPGIPFLLLSA